MPACVECGNAARELFLEVYSHEPRCKPCIVAIARNDAKPNCRHSYIEARYGANNNYELKEFVRVDGAEIDLDTNDCPLCMNEGAE
jgi:hypothetical protein